MTPRPIIDAGPSLNFFAINKERLLFAQVGALHMPETVRAEILWKSREPRFSAASTVIRKLPERLLGILPDDATPELDAVAQRIAQMPMTDRRKQAKDLGELMVVAHAVVLAEAGHDVTVLIDDQAGRQIAESEKRRLRRLKDNRRPVGSLTIAGTITILMGAARNGDIPNAAEMRSLYGRMRRLDDGLVPLESTGLLELAMQREQ